MGRPGRVLTPYTPAWRDAVRPGAQSSAAALVPQLVEEFRPSSVVDIGCGEGWFVKAFAELGVEGTGVDGPWVRWPDVKHVDFNRPPYPELGRFDMAVCLEVAEHVPPQHAETLVDWLTSLAPLVVFSAAVPGQGGVDHVNEQWPQYWAERFAARGMEGSGDLRWRIWDDERIEWWYRQNLLVFGRHALPADGCPAVVHPGMWMHNAWGRTRR